MEIKQHSRAPRPPKIRSVNQPLINMPTTPAPSKANTIQPAWVSLTPFISVSIVGPQSKTPYRTV